MSRAPNQFRFPSAAAPFFLCFFGKRAAAAGIFFLLAAVSQAQTNNVVSVSPPLPDAGASFIRVIGALALVIGLFLGGVWVFKNWQRISLRTGAAPKLNILESRSLGARQGIVVVGYDKQRFLVATSPAGVNLLSHLPDAEISEPADGEKKSAPMPFAQALTQVLKGK
jgi:flagellar biogenesis protein FliO